MKKVSIVFLFLLVTIVFSACSHNAVQPSISEPDNNIYIPVEPLAQEEIAVDITIADSYLCLAALQEILANDNMEGSVQIFLYLLENYKYTSEILDDLLSSREEQSYRRFHHILHVYRRDGLSEADIEVLSYLPLDTQSFLGAEEVHNRYGHQLSFYKIEVNIINGGENNIFPKGQATGIAAFMEDDSQYIDFVLPYYDARNRLEARVLHENESQRALTDAFFIWDEFESIEDFPIDGMVFYLLVRGTEHGYINEDGLYGTVMTQDQLNANAKELLGLEHVDGRDTSFYLAERSLYYITVAGFGGPSIMAVLRVEREQDKTVVYIDHRGYISDRLMESWSGERRIIRYTYINERLVSAVAVDYPIFASIIMTGESG